jgi:putative transposase
MHRNHVYSYDFMVDRRHDGRAIKTLTVIDEYTWEALVIIVARKITSDDVLDCFTDLCVTYGPAEHFRSDNGSEFTARAVRNWLGRIEVKTLFIEPAPGRIGTTNPPMENYEMSCSTRRFSIP